MSKTTIIFLAAALSSATYGFAQDRSDRRSDPDMQRAIQFQRNKDRADARQERRERVRPSVSNADRRMENSTPDPGERQVQKHKKVQ
jgi:hypothetical protein